MFKINFSSETMAETHSALHRTNQKTAANTSLKKVMSGLTALAVAGSLVLASAVPSHADRRGDNLAKALAAAIVLGLIVNNANKGNAHPAPAPIPKPLPVPVKKPRVPNICAIEIDSDQGYPVTVYSENCLQDEGFDYRLPNCGRSVRIYGERDRIYSAQCLRDAGFRVNAY